MISRETSEVLEVLSAAELSDILRAVLVLERMDRALDERVAPIIEKCLAESAPISSGQILCGFPFGGD